MRDKFKLIKSYVEFPFDLFLDFAGKDTAEEVVKTGFITAGKAMKALSEEKETRSVSKIDSASSLINQSPSSRPNLSTGSRYPFTNPELITKIRSIVQNTNNNELRQIISRYASTPSSVRKRSKNIGIQESTIKGVKI